MKGEAAGGQAPLAERMRPADLGEVLGQEHLTGPDGVLATLMDSGKVFPLILWGPPGSGKTTLARIIGRLTRLPFHDFSAVTSGLKELRQVIAAARLEREKSGSASILFVDEIHRFNKAQQDAFLPHVENGLIVLIGATTQNPSFEIIPPLLSRTRLLVLRPLKPEEIRAVLRRALEDSERGLGDLPLEISPEALEHVAALAQGDARVALNNLETAVHYGLARSLGRLDLGAAEKALNRKALPYDKEGEEHYNLISAFHKSMRGSDSQAALYWLYRMLMAGEDPLFIGRRMIRFAAEDVGLADPQALGVALAAFEAWRKVGPPEAELALAEAAVYLAEAPKSNALYQAEKAVRREIELSGAQPVPLPLRNAPTALMKKLGCGRGYLYPHDFPAGWVQQAYLPAHLRRQVFYRPTDRGFEREIRRRLSERGKPAGGHEPRD